MQYSTGREALRTKPIVWAALVLAPLLSACSPYNYGTEIANFAGGIQAIQTADTEGKQQLDEDRRALDHLVWTTKLQPNLHVVNCTATETNCRIIQVLPDKDRKKQLMARASIDQAREVAKPSLKALNSYAKALIAIANAQDAADLEGAQARFQASISPFAGRINPTANTVAIDALFSLFANITLTSLNRSRYEALRDATQSAHENVASLSAKLGNELDRIRRARAGELRAQSTVMVKILSRLRSCGMLRSPKIIMANLRCSNLDAISLHNFYAAYLSELQKVTDKIALLQNQDGTKLAQSLTIAHAALREAVADPSTQTEDVFTAIEQFAESAKALALAFSS